MPPAPSASFSSDRARRAPRGAAPSRAHRLDPAGGLESTGSLDSPGFFERSGLPGAVPWAFGAVSLLFSLLFLTRAGIWSDEAATLTATHRSLPELWRMLGAVDAVHGLYYLLMQPWLHLAGFSIWALRLPSAVAIALAAVVFCRLVDRVSGPRAAVIASALFVVLPRLSWSGTEGRSLAFGTLCAVAATALLFRRLRTGRGLWAYVLVGAIGMHFSILLAALFVAHWAMVLLWRRRALLPVLLAQAGIAVLSAPVMLLAASQQGQVSWINGGLGFTLHQALYDQNFFSPWPLPKLLLAGFTGLLVLSLARRADRRTALTALAWFLVPSVLVVGATLAGIKVYHPRYLGFAAPGLVWAAALGILALWKKWLVLPVAALAVLACLPGAWASKTDLVKEGGYTEPVRMLSGTRTVFFTDDQARGLRTSTDALDEVRDASLAQDGPSGGTLWGTSRPLEDQLREARTVTGKVGLVGGSGRETQYAQALRTHCAQTARHDDERWSTTVWTCR